MRLIVRNLASRLDEAAQVRQRPQPTPTGSLRMPAFLILDSSRLWARYFEYRIEALRITFSEARVLALLKRHPGIRQAHLAKLSRLTPMTLARIVQSMEKICWLERRPDATDRRVWRLFLTPGSRSALTKIERIDATIHREAVSGLSPDERAALMRLLGKARGNLRRVDSEPRPRLHASLSL